MAPKARVDEGAGGGEAGGFSSRGSRCTSSIVPTIVLLNSASSCRLSLPEPSSNVWLEPSIGPRSFESPSSDAPQAGQNAAAGVVAGTAF